MEATRAQVASIVEWLVAAAFIVIVLAAGSVVVREVRTVNAVTPVIAREGPSVSQVPAGVPARAVSVPVLFLSDGKDVRVGDSLPEIAARLGRQAEVGTQSVDSSPAGERLTRFYEHAGTDFILVFESFAPGEEPRVAAIYLQ
jgi:hypothetical protein